MKAKPWELSRKERDNAAELVKDYIDREFGTDTGRLQAALFVDFLAERIGPAFYNNGIRDAIKFMEEKTEDMILLLQDDYYPEN